MLDNPVRRHPRVIRQVFHPVKVKYPFNILAKIVRVNDIPLRCRDETLLHPKPVIHPVCLLLYFRLRNPEEQS